MPKRVLILKASTTKMRRVYIPSWRKTSPVHCESVSVGCRCLPRKQLHITGKDADQSLWTKDDQVQNVIGASEIDYESLNEDELIGLFGHSAPQVTRGAVWTLRKRKGDFIPKVVALIKNGTDIEKRSAIGFFGYLCPPEWALPQTDLIGSVLQDTKESPQVRAAAAYAICWH